MSENDGDSRDFDPVIPLLDGATPPEDYEVEDSLRRVLVNADFGGEVSAVETVPEKDSYAVPRPVVGDTHVASMMVTLKDGRVVRFAEPDGALDESRIFPDVIEFREREVYDLGGGDDG